MLLVLSLRKGQQVLSAVSVEIHSQARSHRGKDGISMLFFLQYSSTVGPFLLARHDQPLHSLGRESNVQKPRPIHAFRESILHGENPRDGLQFSPS